MAPAFSELYGIVVTGAMNPAIHQPAWYLAANILSQDEFESSMRQPFTCTQFASMFRLADTNTQIQCLPDRWEVQVSDAAKITRMREIACRTFELLTHTPVNAFGLNF